MIPEDIDRKLNKIEELVREIRHSYNKKEVKYTLHKFTEKDFPDTSSLMIAIYSVILDCYFSSKYKCNSSDDGYRYIDIKYSVLYDTYNKNYETDTNEKEFFDELSNVRTDYIQIHNHLVDIRIVRVYTELLDILFHKRLKIVTDDGGLLFMDTELDRQYPIHNPYGNVLD